MRTDFSSKKTAYGFVPEGRLQYETDLWSDSGRYAADLGVIPSGEDSL
jgi:hypothetical protein